MASLIISIVVCSCSFVSCPLYCCCILMLRLHIELVCSLIYKKQLKLNLRQNKTYCIAYLDSNFQCKKKLKLDKMLKGWRIVVEILFLFCLSFDKLWMTKQKKIVTDSRIKCRVKCNYSQPQKMNFT